MSITNARMMSKKSDKSDTLKKAMLDALDKTLGVVTPACEMVGISRDTHYRWLKVDESYQEAVNMLENKMLDIAESKLYKQITEKENLTAMLFYLKTKGKNRGYVERQEVTGKDGNKLDVSIEVIRNADKPKD